MKLSKETLEELEKFFQEEGYLNEEIELPFLKGIKLLPTTVAVIVEHSRNKLKKELVLLYLILTWRDIASGME